MVMIQRSLFDATVQTRFETFHLRHPEVLTQLLAMARDLERRGHRRIGMKMLFEVLRWQHMTDRDAAEEFRLNNSYASRYVRLLCEVDPGLGARFEQRELRA